MHPETMRDIIRLLANPLHLRKVGTYFGNNLLNLSYLIKADWMEIRTNHMIVVTPKMNLLQIPIIDEFYVPPSDPASLNRTTSFAEGKGLLAPRQPL